MSIINYSPYPHKPCILLQWPELSVMLDCAIDYSPFFSYLPHVYQSQRLKDANQSNRFNLKYLKDIGKNRVLVEGVPQIRHVSLDALKMEKIDVIVVSNIDTVVALPFYTEGTGFRGHVFMTEIVYQFGKILMEELVEYMARIDFSQIDNQWKKEEIYMRFTNPPSSNPNDWKNLYTADDVRNCLERITTLSFNQSINSHGITLTPLASGYSLGSANWTIATENQKIAYITASSKIASHVKPLDTPSLASADFAIVTCLSRINDLKPEFIYHGMRQRVAESLKQGGNVLFPMASVGLIFELIEAVADIINETPGISMETPIYFISPIAKHALALASISGEWMSTERQNCIYKPEEPFRHSYLIKTGRLKVYDSLYGGFSQEYKTPCVIFTGHSSLRIGDAAHMVEVWGNDSKNTVILTDPDLPVDEICDPFKGLPIKIVSFLLDFRLNVDQMQSLLNDIKPKMLIPPQQLIQPLLPGMPELSLTYSLGATTPMIYDEPMRFIKKKDNMVRVKVNPQLLKNVEFRQAPNASNIAIGVFDGDLSCYDNKYEIKPPTSFNRRKKFGNVTVPMLLEVFKQKKIEAVEMDQGVKLPSMDASVRIRRMSRNIKLMVECESNESRKKIYEIITSILKHDDGIIGSK